MSITAMKLNRENSLTHIIYDYSPVFIQNLFVSYLGKHNWQARFNRYFFERLESLRQIEWSQKGDFEKLQITKLQEVLKNASMGFVYYRNLFENTGFHPDALSSLNALRQLPILEKETLHNQVNGIISQHVERNKLISGHSSGTTGTAIPLVYTQEALANEYAVVWRMRNRVGVELGTLNATFGGRLVVPVKQNKPPFWRINKPGKQVLFSLYHMTKENMKYYVEALQEYDFEYWQGYPSSIYLVAAYLDENGIKLRKPPRAIFTSSESLLAYQRELVERAVGAPIFDRYGNSEFCASMVQCEAGNCHPQLWATWFFSSILSGDFSARWVYHHCKIYSTTPWFGIRNSDF